MPVVYPCGPFQSFSVHEAGNEHSERLLETYRFRVSVPSARSQFEVVLVAVFFFRLRPSNVSVADSPPRAKPAYPPSRSRCGNSLNYGH